MSAVENTAAEAQPAKADAAGKKSAAGSRGKLMMIAGLVLSMAAAGGAGYFLKARSATPAAKADEAPAEHGEAMSHDKPAEDGHGKSEDKGHGEKKGAVKYFALTPAFVVNLNDAETSRFLQLDLEVKTIDSSAAEAITLHMPQIRNALLLLFGQQKFSELETREGKEALQNKVLEEIRRILAAETGKPGVEAVYFTSFVMQ